MAELPLRIKEIDGIEYRIMLPGFDDFGRLSAELASAGSGILGVVAAVQGQGEVSVDIAIKRVALDLLHAFDGGAINRLCSDLHVNDRTEAGADRWLPLRTSKDRDRWRGKYSHGARVLAWTIKEIFGDFFSEIVSDVPELQDLLGILKELQSETTEP